MKKGFRKMVLFVMIFSLTLSISPISIFKTLIVKADPVATTNSGEVLTNSILGTGITASNISFTGNPRQGATFNGATFLPFSDGIILSTGDASQVFTSAANLLDTSFGSSGDADLTKIYQNISGNPSGQTNDAASLQFTVTPKSNKLSFSYLFASEEFSQPVQYNDVFALYVGNQNIALIPGTADPVSISSVKNANCYVDNTSGTSFGFDNYTNLMTCEADVTPNVPVTVRLVIADSSDSNYDSAVLIKADSLNFTPANAPVLTNVSSSAAIGNNITADCDKQGTLYLVPKGNYADKAALEAASLKSTAACNGSSTTAISTSGLTAGTYQLYAVDTSNVLSAPSGDISLLSNTATITITNPEITYLIGQGAEYIDTNMNVTYGLGNILGGTVTIDQNYSSANDCLSWTNSGGIIGSYNPGTGTLTMTGSASAANYQAFLRNILFNSSDTSGTRRIAVALNTTGGTTTAYVNLNFQVPAYAVTFNLNGGTYLGSNSDLNQTVTSNGYAATPSGAITKSGYRFTGWSEDPASTAITGAKTFTAQYVKTYTITFAAGSNGSLTGTTTKVFDEGYALQASDVPTPTPNTGYSFSSWSEDPVGQTVTADKTYTANFAINNYLVTFDLNGGSYSGSNTDLNQNIAYNGYAVTPLGTITKSGYRFTGWSENPASTAITGTKTFTAQYVKTYTVTFAAGANGSLTGTLTKVFDEGYTLQASDIPVPAPNTGYSFGGWSEDPQGQTVTGDKTYTAGFTINSYAVTFDLNGGSYTGDSSVLNQTVQYNAYAMLPSGIVTKAGYRFIGWSENPASTVITGSKTFTAQYVKTYTVTFAAGTNGSLTGTLTKVFDEGYTLQASDIPVPAPNTGYSFGGWSENPQGQTVTGDKIYTASFTINSYAVTFDLNGGSYIGDPSVLNQTIQYNVYAMLPSGIVTKAGYRFIGWSEDPASTAITGAKTFTAQYVKTYTVTFAAGTNGSLTGTLTKVFDEGYTLQASDIPVPAPNTGYSFGGWSGNPEGQVVTSDKTYTASFTISIYPVTFDLNGGAYSGSNTDLNQNITYNGHAITPSGTVTKAGYRFIGWSEDPASTAITGAKTFTAQYVKTYTVTFAAGTNGSLTGTLTKVFDEGYTLQASDIPVPAPNTGYSFGGWSENPQGQVVTSDKTFTANFTINIYPVTFDLNGGAYSGSNTDLNQNIAYNEYAVTPSGTITKSGYRFTGWSENPASTAVTGTKTFTAQYVKTYTVTFAAGANGSLTGTLTKVFDEGYTLQASDIPVPAPNTGYSFGGWSEDPQGQTVTGDKTYTAGFTINSYAVTFDLNGGSYTGDSSVLNQTVQYNAYAMLPSGIVTKAGYRFIGWSENPASTVITGSKTFTAQYVKTYTVTFAAGTNGSLTGTLTKVFDEGYTLQASDIPVPAPNTGYSFGGWSENPEGQVVTSDKTFTASFTINIYPVTFDLNGGSYSGNQSELNQSIQYNAYALLPSGIVTKEGYKFIGWNEDPSTTAIISNKTFTARYAKLEVVDNRNNDGIDVSSDNLTDILPELGIIPTDDVTITLRVQEAATAPQADVTEINQNLGAQRLGEIVDIKLLMQVLGADPTLITSTKTPIKIKITIPKELRGHKDYKIARVHEGQYSVLEDLDNAPDTITFETDKFSTYAIIYTPDSNTNAAANLPKTGGQGLDFYLLSGVLCLTIGTGLIYFKRKKTVE